MSKAADPINANLSLSLTLVPVRGCPDKPGLFFMSSMESDYEISPVAVIIKNGHLVACDMYLGDTNLAAFHSGLTEVKWYEVG